MVVCSSRPIAYKLLKIFQDKYPEWFIEKKTPDGVTATAEELCTLPGVGESRAQDIISYRTKHGEFENVEEIMQVPGIKEGLYEKIQNKIYIE